MTLLDLKDSTPCGMHTELLLHKPAEPATSRRHLAKAVEVGAPDAGVPREGIGHGQQGGLAAHAQVQQHG